MSVFGLHKVSWPRWLRIALDWFWPRLGIVSNRRKYSDLRFLEGDWGFGIRDWGLLAPSSIYIFVFLPSVSDLFVVWFGYKRLQNETDEEALISWGSWLSSENKIRCPSHIDCLVDSFEVNYCEQQMSNILSATPFWLSYLCSWKGKPF